VDALERLRALILPDEQAALRRQQQALEALAARQERLPRDLPDLLARAGEGQGARRLRDALAAPVADALGEAVRQRRQVLVDALFPVMGPAIRKAIAEYLRNFTDGLNRAVEYSLTPRGLMWRLEAWRSGVPFAHVVLRHTLRFRIDHLFLIDAESGIVLHRADAPDLPDLDADAVAGMLTALGDFVRDAVAGGSNSLDAATVGEHTVLVERGPRANLACFLRGVPTPGLRTVMARALERIHWQFDDPNGGLGAGAADAGALWEQVLDLAALDRAAREADPDAGSLHAAPARWPAWLALLLLLAVIAGAAWWAWRAAQWREQVDHAVAALDGTPGIVVTAVDIPRTGAVRLRILKDPLAEPAENALRTLLPASAAWSVEARGYLSADLPIVVARARAAVADWPDIRVGMDDDDLLVVRGVVPTADDLERLRQRLVAVPGVTAVDTTTVSVATDPQQIADAALAAARAELSTLAVRFGDADAPLVERDAQAALDAMLAAIDPAAAAAAAAGRRLAVTTHGYNDETGSSETNRRVRELRARWLAARLAAARPTLDITAAPDDAAVSARDERSATARIAYAP
jgi:hypothetical protein